MLLRQPMTPTAGSLQVVTDSPLDSRTIYFVG
jgi:hypothetical protein